MNKVTCGCEMVGCNDYIDEQCHYEKDYCKYNLPQEHELIEENNELKAALAEKEKELAELRDKVRPCRPPGLSVKASLRAAVESVKRG